MADSHRVVFDSSVLVSASIFRKSTPSRAVDAALRQSTVLFSPATLDELKEVLARPKFDRYVEPEMRNSFRAGLARSATLVEVSEIIDACRDPKDNKFLELAVAGRAEYIVSGDDDLLVLDPFRGIRIVTPAEFLELLAGEREADANT